MERIAAHCSWGDLQVLSDRTLCAQLPPEALEIIRTADGPCYLDTIARLTLIPNLTEQLFTLYEPLAVEFAARWVEQTCAKDVHSSIRVFACFARVLPHKPCFEIPLQAFLEKCDGGFIGSLAESSQLQLLSLDTELLSCFLLALFRVYSYDAVSYGSLVSPVQLSSLLRHEAPSVRYLAVRCLVLYMKLADAMAVKMIAAHVPDKGAIVKTDCFEASAQLFILWEERRLEKLEQALVKAQFDRDQFHETAPRSLTAEMLSSQTATVAGILLPRIKGHRMTPSFVATPTTSRNFENLARALLHSRAILLTGASSSGKTLLVTETAKLLNKLPSMITLHLNEQTDSKSLLGIYTTSTEGSFVWQPGVLTRAMREGRWVLMEDIDRSPAEVLSVILPIIEHGEILISGRKERIRATTGFRVLATTTEGVSKIRSVTSRLKSKLNTRLWTTVAVESLQPAELEMLLSTLFPVLKSHVPSFLLVHSSVQQLFAQRDFKAIRIRPPDLRDLLKWCRRSSWRLKTSGLQTGAEPTGETVLDDIFTDAVSCYAGHIQSRELHVLVSVCIAEVLQIPPQRMRHCIYERLPCLSEDGHKVCLGRATYSVINHQTDAIARINIMHKSPFALTRGTLKNMEELLTAIRYAEPILLVGETGIGKTAVVQHLATLVGQKLSVFNLSQQSESGDLLGGLKPITTKSLVVPMSATFDALFENTFSLHKNTQFLASIRKCVLRGNWTRLILHWQEAVNMADSALRIPQVSREEFSDNQPSKKRKLPLPKQEVLRQRWRDFTEKLSYLKAQVSRRDKNFALAFVEGRIVQALRNGEWVLLDEINLATVETLESISDLLYSQAERLPSLLLSESGRLDRVEGHQNFRLLAAMNPATDTGKRELPVGLRTRFTELYMHPSDANMEDLIVLSSTYLGTLPKSDHKVASDLAKCYLDVQKMNQEKCLTDGSGQLPHFSIRSLVRALLYANHNASIYGLRRALYEGFLMSFATMLSIDSEKLVRPTIERHLFGHVKNARSLLNQNLKRQQTDTSCIVFGHYLVERGDLALERQPQYIITPFVERNLLNLARAVSLRRFPILLQGPTSSGKTSMVEYLAKISGNKFIRINNHEHTDLQEYLGSYNSGDDGRLQYREGILVDAIRHGSWIVLDELNLAPVDVLEGLNRLLDDNRELLIPETQEVVKPHPKFLLFATQNPAGLYGGRKYLSRALRNRFLELHFNEIPENELEFILKERSQIAPSFCEKIVAVYKKLSAIRQSSRLFEQRNSFATLRDLFRWASRRADDRDQLAVNGFMLLAEKVRDRNERNAVKQIIEEVMKVSIDDAAIYTSRSADMLSEVYSNLIWTPAMRRLLVLIATALENDEPVLLIGETGSGKTQACQAVAEISGRHLRIVNAHSNMETGDLIGSQRPTRGKVENERKLRQLLQSFLAIDTDGATSSTTLEELIHRFESVDVPSNQNEMAQEIKACIAKSRSLFEWNDGSLVVAMRRGEHFLLDEISLAEDSVLERLNSVLEPQRSILLAEKGSRSSFIRASSGFQFLATMNPGGDYGKRELSTALRNRFTEIWVPPLSEQTDVLPILQSKLRLMLSSVPHVMLKFAQWFRNRFHALDMTNVSLRELITWADFVRSSDSQDLPFILLHGASLVFIDSLGANPAAIISTGEMDVEQAQRACVQKLGTLLHLDMWPTYSESPAIEIGNQFVRCAGFSIRCGILPISDPDLVFDTPSTRKNALRVLRALQLPRPILLEGDPGVGKTALVEAIARATRRRLTRINLSDQTDLMDLFGSDVPIQNGSANNFGWRDGPLLQAMERGDWVLLDEMNLASQSVLEGLNSCLDHRKQVYVAELGRNFVCHQDFVLFATQNPHHQGGGRKGLPASFVSRFSIVYMAALAEADLMIICQSRYREVQHSFLPQVVSAVSQCRALIQSKRSFDSRGGPWEVNFRDISRWLSLCEQFEGKLGPANFHDLVASQRFRTLDQRNSIRDVCNKCLAQKSSISMFSNLSTSFYQLGAALLERNRSFQPVKGQVSEFSPHLLPYAQSLVRCINQRWPAILVGESGSGKSTLIRSLAALKGSQLIEVSVTEDMDTIDLIGGYEQIHQDRAVDDFARSLRSKLLTLLPGFLIGEKLERHFDGLLEIYRLCDTQRLDPELLRAALMPIVSQFPEFLGDFHLLEQLISRQSVAQKANFGWNDGVLVDAAERGYWLVLDNANTCNSAVLDRLNSLLETGGQLVVSEQHDEDGRPRIVRPHNDFRIFLTMDPRLGELSRAMRNRCVEIYLVAADVSLPASKAVAYPTDAAMFRWRRLQAISFSTYDDSLQLAVAQICVDHLSLHDLSSVSATEYRSLAGQSNNQAAHELFHYVLLPESLFKAIHDLYIEMIRSCPLLEGIADEQPLHPETDELLLHLAGNESLSIKAARLGWLLESFVSVRRIRQLLADAESRAGKFSVLHMTVLERSIAAQRAPDLAKDAVRPLTGLIHALTSAADEALTFLMTNFLGHDYWPAEKVTAILNFLKDVVNLSKDSRIQTGVLPEYIKIGEELFSKTSPTYPATAELLECSLTTFGNQTRLGCGRSLFRLWTYWRPKYSIDIDVMNALLKLEVVMEAFDIYRQRSHFRREMVKVQQRLLATRDAIFKGAKNTHKLLEELQPITSSLKSNAGPHHDRGVSYFGRDFEALCQYQDLEIRDSPGLQDVPSESPRLAFTAFFAGRETRRLVAPSELTHGPAVLSRIASFAGWDNPIRKVAAWKGRFAEDLLCRLDSCHNEPIKSIDSLAEEISWLSKSICDCTSRFPQNQLDLLKQLLLGLICDVIVSHRDLLKHELQSLIPTPPDSLSTVAASFVDFRDHDVFHGDVPDDHHFRPIWDNYLRPALSLAASPIEYRHHQQIGACLVFFALALLQLWVPDRPADPALSIMVQRARYQRRKVELDTKIEALEVFESSFSGQSTSLRIRRAKQEVALIGLEPPTVPVVRLEDVDLLQLQAEFSNILDGITTKMPEMVLLSNVEGPFQDEKTNFYKRSEETEFLRRNIERMVQRLSQSPRQYDDLSVPVVRFLQTLDLGASMLNWSERKREPTDACRLVAYIADHTPLLGATPSSMSDTNAQNVLDTRLLATEVLYLQTAGLVANLSPWLPSDLTMQSKMFSGFESCYSEWKAHLQADQSEAAKKAKYYEYRGPDISDDEAEVNGIRKIFPTSDDVENSCEKVEDLQRFDSKAFALEIADLHARIFAPKKRAALLEHHLLQMSKSMSLLLSGNAADDSSLRSAESLPAVLLLLDDYAQFLRSEKSPKEYNIYTDLNVSEVRKLLLLVDHIKDRAEAINEAWSEHAVPPEILACCNGILCSKISEPLAKVLTKVEKLHSILGEWQVIASRKYSVAPLIDELTTLIVTWRRLELSSWSRLLTEESSRCQDDAKSWWFVVYEVVISIPLRLIDEGHSLASHVQDLASTLISFLRATNLGQYSCRLRVLEHFYAMAESIIPRRKALSVISGCLYNVIEHFKRYEVAVQKSLTEGREQLEEEVRTQIKLASWKDTTVITLRESVRQSHYKLFKIVKKFRSLLAQPIDTSNAPAISQDRTYISRVDHVLPVFEEKKFSEALGLVEKHVSRWSDAPRRFREPHGAAASMRELYGSSKSDINVGVNLHEYVLSLRSRITELQSQTPLKINDENRALILHLKARKRRLLADVLKDVRHMGIRRNLSLRELGRQNSLTSILGKCFAAKENGMSSNGESNLGKYFADSRDHFHGFLDLIDKARNAQRECSADLSSSEVGRCAGYLEGLLLIMQNQRHFLSSLLPDLTLLQRAQKTVCNLQSLGTSDCVTANDSAAARQSKIRFVVSWIPHILEAACKILEIQTKYAEGKFRTVFEGLRSYQAYFTAAGLDLENVLTQELPPSVQSQQAYTGLLSMEESMAKFRNDLSIWILREPDAAYLLTQLVPWTDWTSVSGEIVAPERQATVNFEGFKQRLLATIDRIFVAIQKFCSKAEKLPNKVDDAAWLILTDEGLTSSIRTFQIKQIATEFKDVLSLIPNLEGPEFYQALSLCVIFAPLVHQFYNICRHTAERYANLHAATCKLSHALVKSFNSVASEGFCGPDDRCNTAEEGAGKLEQGIGLAEGHGTEDVSKDVANDEDLSELAQQQRTDQEENIENEENAVDMRASSLQGEMDEPGETKGDADSKVESESGSADNDLEEETGSVDDLDPSAVDEKLWEGLVNKKQKDVEKENGAGRSSKKETAAHRNENRKQISEAQEALDEEADDEETKDEEDVRQPQAESADPHLQQEQALELPEEMRLDGDQGAREGSISNDGLDEVSDFEDEAAQTLPTEEKTEEERFGQDDLNFDQYSEVDQTSHDSNIDGQAIEDEVMEDKPGQEESTQEENQQRTRTDENDNKVEGMVGGEVTASRGNDEKSNDKESVGSSGMPAQAEVPATTQEQPNPSGNDSEGNKRQGLSKTTAGNLDPSADRQAEAFKKLGDALEDWHRQREIFQPLGENRVQESDVCVADADFEHVENDEDNGETQALGPATKDQAKSLHDRKAFEDPESQGDTPPSTNEPRDTTPPSEPNQAQEKAVEGLLSKRSQESGSFIAHDSESTTAAHTPKGGNSAEELDDVDHQLSSVDLSQADLSPLTSPEEALRLWSHYSSLTHPLSLILTEQLRLILSPTQATKLRGDFRTGKRLNIKRIIPYIASQYKRDKIWMRRSMPSKRNYQVLVAVDDSKSMTEGGAQSLAFETLALLCKSLSMLEVGEICVVGFGDEEHIRIAHSFGTPFTNESGAKVYQNFSFQQNATNVKKLIQESIQLFREARAKGPGSNTDLWQLQLIISDGICEEHESIRRLVRQASEERIMIVFVIVDSNSVKGNSIMDLTQAVFEPEEGGGSDVENSGRQAAMMKLKMKRYLDGFPFPYYVVVREVDDLPGVLATALKGWFREVVDA